MKWVAINKLIFIIIVLFTGCYNANKTTEQLSNHYFFRNYGVGKREIYPDNVYVPTKIYADVIDYAANDSFIVAQQVANFDNYKSSLGFDLYMSFLGYSEYLKDPGAADSVFGTRVKKLIEKDSLVYRIFMSRGANPENSTKEYELKSAVADSLLKDDPYYTRLFNGENFWIISIARDSLYGPFLSRTQYLRAKKTLGISTNLRLGFEKE